MLDSSPVVCITGQVGSKLLGSDAFQEIDITGITMPITKHNVVVCKVEDIARTVREDSNNPTFFLLTSRERHASMIVLGWEGLPQGAIDPAPRRGHLAHGHFANDLATLVKADVRAHFCPHRSIDLDADPAHNRKEVGLRAEPGAPPSEIATRAFEHLDVPPDGAEKVCGE
jgi:hypothetical protein